MKILSAEQTRALDKATTVAQNISSIELMERAAQACTSHINNIADKESTRFIVVCGQGNNGGDGMAIARLLKETRIDAPVEIFILEHSSNPSEDFSNNLTQLKKSGITPQKINESNSKVLEEALTSFHQSQTFLIDAIFGSGLNKPVEGWIAEIISAINKSGLPVISIDIPSGLASDIQEPQKDASIVRAGLTLTFQYPKASFMLPENSQYTGEFIIVDIGLDESFTQDAKTEFHYTTDRDAKKIIKPRLRSAHKGNFGHALLAGGSEGKAGAIQLAAKACLRCGAGLLTAHVPGYASISLHSSLPEAMLSIDENENFITSLPSKGGFTAVGLGPGMGTNDDTERTLKYFIQNFSGPMVVDADALNILSENKTWLAFLQPFTVLTPHPKEFDRIAGAHANSASRLESARELAVKHRLVIVLKGAHTAIVLPDKQVFFNSTGNAAMAKGGSGDVLTGMITGLLARGYNPVDAAILGVYLHGLAGDLGAAEKGAESLLASEITDKIPDAFRQLSIQ